MRCFVSLDRGALPFHRKQREPTVGKYKNAFFSISGILGIEEYCFKDETFLDVTN